jgi:tripartite-type tricarboxylate transporter receptor subunit TctC
MRYVFLIAGWIATAAAFAQEPYPSRPVRVIVAYPPGAGVDLMARAAAQKLTESLGQPVPVDNRPGANGVVGAQAVARATPDGYTLLVIDRGALTINPSLYKALPYDPLSDFAYIGVSAELQYVLAINAALPAADFQEFVQLAKAKPGAINYASFGSGSIVQLNFEQMNSSLGLQLTHVPYKGAAQAAMATINGEVGVMMSSLTGVAGFIRDGRLRALAVGRPTRSPLLPQVPTISEVGGGSDTLVPTYFTFVAPAATPRPIVSRLNAELGRILSAPDMVERLAKAGLEPQVSTPEEFAEGVKRDTARFGKLVNALGIPPQ